MQRYRFKKSVIVETPPHPGEDGVIVIKNVQAEAGQEIDEDDLPAGTIASLLGTKSLEKIDFSKAAKKGSPDSKKAKAADDEDAADPEKDKATKK